MQKELKIIKSSFTTPTEITDFINNYQWILKPLGKMLTGNFMKVSD